MLFRQLLLRHRQERGLSQERLAHLAEISERTISDLERGVYLTARAATARQLAGALGLAGADRDEFMEAAATGRTPDHAPAAHNWTTTVRTLPRDVADFTGRARDLELLMGALPGEPAAGGVLAIHTVSGMAGVGKTTFMVHAAHQLTGQFPDGQIFLRLNGHAPGQRPLAPAAALASLLRAAGADPRQIPADLDARARLWRGWLAGKRMLLLLDDAIDSGQVRPLLPGTEGSLVLITSRRKLTALEDARPIALDVLTDAEAAALLVRLADRPGLDPDDPVIAQIAQLCGNLPLALGMLGSQLRHHRAWTPTALAAELAHAHDRLDQIHAEDVTVAAAFDLSYRDLTEGQRKLFRELGLHPGIDIDAWAAAALHDTSPADARRHLRELCDHNMIAEPGYGRYRLHDLIREYAAKRALAEDSPAERDAAIGRLLDYYLCAAADAGRHMSRRTPAGCPRMSRPEPARWPEMPDRQQAMEWMAAEHLNLQAAAAYAAEHGQAPHAIAIAAATHGFLRGRGYWDQALRLHQTALEAAEHAEDALGQIGALTDLGDMQYLTGAHVAAEISLTRALELARQLGNPLAEANALSEFGVLKQATGDLPTAEASLTQALYLSRSQSDLRGEANALTNLGVVQFIRGDFPAAANCQEQALTIYGTLRDQLGEASALNSLGGVRQAIGDYPPAIDSFTRALELYRSVNDQVGQAYATGNLGAVQAIIGDYPAAAVNLSEALGLYRKLGSRNGEADMLSNLGALDRMTGKYQSAIDFLTGAIVLYRELKDSFGEAAAMSELGVVQHRTGDYPAAINNLTQSIRLARDSGERASEAEALNNLGDLYLDAAMAASAHDTFSQALAIAADITSPLEEGRALAGIGRCLLRSGQHAAGVKALKQSVAVYEQINSPHANRVKEILSEATSPEVLERAATVVGRPN